MRGRLGQAFQMREKPRMMEDSILIQTRPEIQTGAEADYSVWLWTGFTPISKPITPARY